MADNTTLPGTGEVYAAKERGGSVKYQRVLISADDSGSIDGFGRWRTANPTTIFDSKLTKIDDAPLLWDESLESGSGITASTPTADLPYVDFTSTLNTAAKFTRQTFRRFNYQPGKSQLALITGVLDLSGGGTGVERRIGIFDDDNGLFFYDNAGTYGVAIRSSVTGSAVDTTVAQASWNIDTMDGGNDAANPSGYTVDFTKTQIFVIDFQWLGIGRIRFGLEMPDGAIYYVHEYASVNTTATVWASTPNFPVRYQMITTGSSPVSTMRCICSTIISEGGTDDIGVIHYESTEGAAVTSSVENTIYAVMGIRLKSTHLGTAVKLINASVQIQTASEYIEWMLIWNPTVASTFTYSDHANSSVQTAKGATANTVTNGHKVAGGFAQSGKDGGLSTTELSNALMLGADIAGVVDELVLCFRPIGGVSAADVEGAITWREL